MEDWHSMCDKLTDRDMAPEMNADYPRIEHSATTAARTGAR